MGEESTTNQMRGGVAFRARPSNIIKVAHFAEPDSARFFTGYAGLRALRLLRLNAS